MDKYFDLDSQADRPSPSSGCHRSSVGVFCVTEVCAEESEQRHKLLQVARGCLHSVKTIPTDVDHKLVVIVDEIDKKMNDHAGFQRDDMPQDGFSVQRLHTVNF